MLMSKVKEVKPSTVKLLLKHGADVTIRDNLGGNPLAGACVQGWLPIVDLLVEANAEGTINKCIYANNNSPLLIAVMQDFFDGAKVLVEHGADINHFNTFGVTAVYAAISTSKHPEPIVLDFLRYLVSRGAKADRQDTNGVTPLLIACECDHVATVSFLLDQGADPTKVDRGDQSAMHRVMGGKGRGQLTEGAGCEMLQLLLASGKIGEPD